MIFRFQGWLGDGDGTLSGQQYDQKVSEVPTMTVTIFTPRLAKYFESKSFVDLIIRFVHLSPIKTDTVIFCPLDQFLDI